MLCKIPHLRHWPIYSYGNYRIAVKLFGIQSLWYQLAIYLQRYCYYFAAHKLLLPVSCNKLCKFYVHDGRTFHSNR